MVCEDKVAIVTGGGTGIGRAIALRFIQQGARLTVVGRRREPLDALVAEAAALDGEAHAVQADLTQEEDARHVIGAALETYGEIDILVNNAGVAGYARLIHEIAVNEWEEIIRGNLTLCYLALHAVLPYFAERRRGSIVNVGSIAGCVGMPGMSAYGAAKAGIVALTRSVAVEYAHLGVRCNCVCPGTIESPMTAGFLANPERRQAVLNAIPAATLGTPDDVARIVVALAADDAQFLTGAVIAVDGGFTAR